MQSAPTAIQGLLTDGIAEFRRYHGEKPPFLVAQRDALAVACLAGKLKLEGIPVIIAEALSLEDLHPPGQGQGLALVLTRLPGERWGTLVVEATLPTPL